MITPHITQMQIPLLSSIISITPCTSKYFVSHNQFYFIQGQHYVDRDLIIEDIDNFTVTGPTSGQCSIICTSPASIVVLNATTIKLLNISLVNCIRNHKDYINTLLMLSDYYVHNKLYARDSVPFSTVTDYYTSLFIWNSSSVIIYNMNVTLMPLLIQVYCFSHCECER